MRFLLEEVVVKGLPQQTSLAGSDAAWTPAYKGLWQKYPHMRPFLSIDLRTT